ncbi:MAG: hypothetical protein EZS28_048046, partial [Streblomastix strix]
YGTTKNDPDTLTGDSQIDDLASPRTIRKGSQTQKIQYEPTEIFINREGDELLEHRVYSINGPFNGLEALFALFIQSAKIILEDSRDPDTPMPSLPTTAVQDMATLLIYDMKGGNVQYRAAIVQQQTDTMNLWRTLLIIIFAVSIVTTFIGYVFCLVPERTVLYHVAEGSAKMRELDPAADASDRTGMGASAWKDEYSCDCIRLDREHQKMLISLAGLCRAIDGTMNVAEQYSKLQQLM